MTTQFFLRCLIGTALGTGVFGQGLKPPGGAAGGGRTSVPSNAQPNSGVTTPDFSQHPFFLSGKVTMEDGTAPTDSVTIQLVCHGSPRSIGHTDSKGGFSIDLNNRASMITAADASENDSLSNDGAPVGGVRSAYANTSGPGSGGSAQQGVSDRDLMGCDVQAALAGLPVRCVPSQRRRSMDDPNVGTIIMHRLANVEGSTISVTSAMAPKDARKKRW